MAKIYTTWPANEEGKPGGSWYGGRWLVLDITHGLANHVVVAGPMTRSEANARELELRREDMAQRERVHVGS